MIIEPRGPFSLAAAERFLTHWPAHRGGLRTTFLVDDWRGTVTVELSEGVRVDLLETTGDVDPERLRAQLARVLSLDGDGLGWASLGERDGVLGTLQRASGWLRPVNFFSPYEALAWFVITARLRTAQARKVWLELGAAFPAPERLLAMASIPGLAAEKVQRLHGVARAALEGGLDAGALLADPARSVVELQSLRGVGPFSAEGTVLRGAGAVDLLPLGERRVRAAAAHAYGVSGLDDDAEWVRFGERWAPFRGWAAVLLRATAE